MIFFFFFFFVYTHAHSIELKRACIGESHNESCVLVLDIFDMYQRDISKKL